MAVERPIDQFPYRYEVVPVGKLMVDPSYQRDTKGREEKIAEDWKPHLVGTLCVSERRGRAGKVMEGAVFDGQTRWMAAQIKGVSGLPCLVYEGLNRGEEAILFAEIQQGRRNATSYETFRALLVAGNEGSQDPGALEAIELDELVSSTGYRIGDAPRGRQGDALTIPAVSALRACFRRDPVALERALLIFNGAWAGKDHPTAWHIRGLHLFLIQNENADDDKLRRKLKAAGADAVYRRALMARQAGGMGSQGAPYMAMAIKGTYQTSEERLKKSAA